MNAQNMMTPRERSTALVIPKPRGEIIGAYVVAGFVTVFVVVAISNLFQGIAWLPSTLWLGIVVLVIASNCRHKGLKRYLVNFLGSLSERHFADTVILEDGQISVRFGFVSLSHHLFYQTIPIARIESVEWHTGQATSLAGRDMNDWHVAIWFDHGDAAKSERQRKWHRKPDQDVYIVGPSLKKERTAAFGQEVLRFLRDAGAVLVREKDDCTYVRASTSSMNEECPAKPRTVP